MTRQRSFKRLVRTRMEKTGESYTAARAVLLAGDEAISTEEATLVVSDATICARTGRGWEGWFDLLDDWGASERPHKEIARHVAAELGIEALGWDAQAIIVSYERARCRRAVGQRADGSFTITALKTVAVPVEQLFDAFADEALRTRWLPTGELRERTATRPKSARFDCGYGDTRVSVSFEGLDEAKSTVAVEHSRLRDAGESERMKAFWRERLSVLRSQLEGAETDS